MIPYGKGLHQFSKLDRLEEKGNFVSTFPIEVLNLKTQKLKSLGRTFEPVRLGFSPDGRYLAWITAFSSDMGNRPLECAPSNLGDDYRAESIKLSADAARFEDSCRCLQIKPGQSRQERCSEPSGAGQP